MTALASVRKFGGVLEHPWEAPAGTSFGVLAKTSRHMAGKRFE
jgi:hypothetical protein